jgi:uncharacterized protein (TIGR02599 family)
MGYGPNPDLLIFDFVDTCALKALPLYYSRQKCVDKSFTLVEMLVAIAVLSILLVLASQLITRTSSVWIYSTSKMAEGREARVAFSSLCSRLSEATVDQYYGYTYSASTPATTPATYYPNNYVRRSELRFICGPSATINTTVASSPTDAVFFSAPLGVVSNTASYGHLPSLLNVCGYYVQWSNNDLERPSILPGTGIYRFRLMQFVQPAESMSIYSQTIPNPPTPASSPVPGPAMTGGGNGNYPLYSFVTGTSWQNTAMNNSPSGVHPLANNVVALLLLPATNTTDASGTLAPGFVYNSEVATAPATTAALTSVNRTPPVVRIVMYTIDEKSALRLTQSATMPNLYVSTSGTPLFANSALLYPNPTSGDSGDLARFEQSLTANKLAYRRFDAAVELPRQPWNTQN